MPRTSSKRKSRSPCKYGRKKSLRKGCKAKPGPKRSRRSSRRSRRRCSRGSRKGSSVCKRKPGPKRRRRSRKSKRRSRKSRRKSRKSRRRRSRKSKRRSRRSRKRKSSPRKNYQCKYGRNASGFCVPRDVCKTARLKNKRCVSKGGLGADQWNVPPLYGCQYGRSGNMNNSLNQPVGKCQKPGVFEKLRKKLFGDDAQQSPAEVMQRHYANDPAAQAAQAAQAGAVAAQMGRDFGAPMPMRRPPMGAAPMGMPKDF